MKQKEEKNNTKCEPKCEWCDGVVYEKHKQRRVKTRKNSVELYNGQFNFCRCIWNGLLFFSLIFFFSVADADIFFLLTTLHSPVKCYYYYVEIFCVRWNVFFWRFEISSYHSFCVNFFFIIWFVSTWIFATYSQNNMVGSFCIYFSFARRIRFASFCC